MKRKRARILPDDAYDFFVVDHRDGEEWGPYHTIERAREEARSIRRLERAKEFSSVKIAPSIIEVIWRVNEEKIMGLLRLAPKEVWGRKEVKREKRKRVNSRA